jgi:hypothetical protein
MVADSKLGERFSYTNHSNFEKLTFGDKFIWLLNSESKDTLICMCQSLFYGC